MVKSLLKSVVILLLFAFPGFTLELNPGDGVRVTLFNVTDLVSGDYFVQIDGRVQLPFIGPIETTKRDFADVKSEIFTKYDSLYKNPELTIQPLLKIKILGEVRNPGIYFVTGVEKLSDLMALAGGETDDTNLKKIYIIQGTKKRTINVKKVLENGQVLSDLGLESGMQIYVPKKLFRMRNISLISSGIAIVVTVVNLLLR